jgi:hypothetical protein
VPWYRRAERDRRRRPLHREDFSIVDCVRGHTLDTRAL